MEMEPQNPPTELDTTSDSVSQEKKTKKASKPRKTTKQTQLSSEPQMGGSGIDAQAQTAQNNLSPQDGTIENQENAKEKPKRKRTKKSEGDSTPQSDSSDLKAVNSTSPVTEVDSAITEAVGTNQAASAGGVEKKTRKPRKSTNESGRLEAEGEAEKKPRKSRKSTSESELTDDSAKSGTEKQREVREKKGKEEGEQKEREEREKKEREERERKEKEEREQKEREEREKKEREERERKEKEEREQKEREEREKKEREERERKEKEERIHSDSFDASELRITRFPSYLLDRMDRKARNILTYSLNKLNSMNMKDLGVCIDELNANKGFYDPQYSAEKDLYFHIIKLIKYLENRLKEEEEKTAQKFFRQEFIDPYHDGKFNKIIKKCNNDPANSAWEIVDKMGRKIQQFPYNEGVLRKWIEEYLKERLQKPNQ